MNVDQPVRQNPFPGLRPFTTEEDYLFFGREEQTTELLGLLREHRFLAVVGTSGSGKSSLVRAGLLPALHGGTMAQAGSAWEVLVLRPGGDPITNLARALVEADLYDPEDAESLPRIVATLSRSRLGLVEAVRQSDLPEGTNLLVVVDQFEELFRFRQAGVSHQEAASAFVKLLLAAAREADQRLYIAITMRSDYLGECSHIAGLAEAVNDGEYLIPRLSRDQRRAAIEKPVSVGGGTISHRLVQKLLNDVGDDTDHLPVLQHALMRIFDYWAEDHADGEPLDLRHYERAGGLNEALSRHSDEVFDELPTDRLRTVAEKLFKALTERGPDSRGIRRPTRLDKLGAIIDAQQEEVVAVVEAFRRAGRTFLMPMSEVELEPHTVTDISHESLMRVWKRLDRWVEQESQSARIYRRLADTAALHAEGKAGSYHDPDLQIALTWRETEHPTEAWAARYHSGFEQALAFLEKSRDVQRAEEQQLEAARQRELDQAKKLAAAERLRAQEQKRSAHRMKWLSGGVAVVAGLALIAFGVAMAARQEAQHLAQKEAQTAGDERTARAEAEEAKNREANEKSQAEDAKKDADASRKRAEEALKKAEENFTKARAAVNDYLTAVSEDERLKAPGFQGLRIQLLQSALQFYQEFLKERGNDPTLRRELAGVYYKVGEVYRDLLQFSAATPSYAQARRLYEALAVESPNDPELQHGLAMALYRSGARAQGIPILEKLINPEDPRYHSDLGSMYNDAGLNDAKSDKATELEFLRKALTIRERLVRLKPDDPDARLGLSGSLNNIAIRLRDNHSAEALALLQRAVEQCEAAYRLRPADTLTARFLTIQLNNVANFGKNGGETEIVLAAHRRRVEVLDRRARDNPTVPGFDAELVGGHAILLVELRDAGRLEEAAKSADKARARLAETTEESPGFFAQVLGLQLTVHALALARAKADPDAEVNTEHEAAAAVNAIRQHVLAGWRSPAFMQTDPRMEPLRQRADFKELLVRMEELGPADAKAKLTTDTAGEKLAARQKILTTLEALAGPPPYARFVRRNLAQARQDWAQALLEAGQVEEARIAFDDALAARQRLVQESPSNEQLRADLAQSQSAAGDLFAAAGKLADAVKTWNKALATLEVGLKTNPNSIPFRAALAERLRHIAFQAGKFALWDVAAKHYGRAMVIQIPTEPLIWNLNALVAAETQDLSRLRALADLAARGSENTGDIGLFRHRTLTTSPATAAAHVAAVRRLADEMQNQFHNVRWIQALAYLRLGQAEKALQTVAELTPAEKGWPEWQVLALIQHRLGHAKAAAEALRQADLLAERRMQGVVAGDQLKLPIIWDEWLHNQVLRNEAHQSIHGKPLPESPYEKLFRGRVFFALEQLDKAEVEFAAAVAIRPDDADVWLTRSRVFAGLGRKDQMAADVLRAQELKGNDPRTWIETGRMLAERGEHKQADAAFARATALGKGELNRFLEAGWWAVGPYPENLDLPCPPELNPDPSTPVAAVGEKRELKWQSVSTTAHSGNINLPHPIGGQSKASSYALAYVYADRDQTAALHLWPKNDARVWINGRIVFAGFGEGQKSGIISIPVALRKGRNTLLVKNHHDNGVFCECAFLDAPVRRGYEMVRLGLWAEAADAFAEADRRAPLQEYPSRLRIQALRAAGRDEEARQVFAEMVRRHDQSGSLGVAETDFLPPNKTEDRDRRIVAWRKHVEANPTSTPGYHRLANACFRAGQFAEAETNLRKAMANDQLYFHPLLASTLHYVGKTDEAKKTLAEMEEKHARLVKEALAATPYRPAQHWEEEVWYQATLREARTLILGKDPGPSADETALLAKARERLAELEMAEDDYARLVEKQPDQPRLWIDRGRRLGELKRWDEATKAFDKAAELAPKGVQVWKERGRAYADLGKWDEAAADFIKAMELVPTTKSDWLAGSFKLHDQVVRLEEVFPRVAKLRPTDRQLWIQRVHYLSRTAQWPEAAKAIARVVELDPEDHFTWHFQATLLAHGGDLEAYRQVCRDMMTRFGNTDIAVVAQRIGTACLIAPKGVEDASPVLLMMNRVKRDPAIATWHDAALGIGYYRAGQWDQALKVLAPFSRASGFNEVMALAVRGMAQFKQDQPEAARQTLQQAREGLARFAKPGPGELQDNWYNWHQAQIVLHEAEALIPAAPVVAGTPGSTAQDYAAQRDRKARADSLATQAALAQIRLDVGQKKEAEVELRAVLAEREKIAAEEPVNLDYQFALASTRLRLGQFLADSGEFAEALKESEAALAFLEKVAAKQPKGFRLRVEAALMVQAIGDVHAKANRPTDALKSWMKGIELLSAALKENPDNRTFGAALAKAEEKLGNEYGSLTLWPECGDLLGRAVRRPGGGDDAWRWLRAGQASLAAGNVAQVRKLAAEAFERFRTATASSQLTALVELMALTNGPKESLTHMIPLAEKVASESPKTGYLTVLNGIYEYRAGQFAQTVQRLEAPEYRNEPWSKAFLAMAQHRLGKAQEAQEWRTRAEEVYIAGLRKRVEQSAPGVGPIWWNAVNDLIFFREAHELISGKPMPLDPLERLCRARAYLHLGETAMAEAEMKAAVETQPADPLVWLVRSQIFTKLDRPKEAAADRARALQLAEQALVKRPEDTAAADVLASILREKLEPKWAALKPLTVRSEGGATLTVQPDDSVLASGVNPDQEVYVIEAEVQGRIGAIRLEAIPDPSMVKGGSGRNTFGNFILTDFRVTAGEVPVTWKRAVADFSQAPNSDHLLGLPIAHAIDADESTGWAIGPRVAEPHWAVFLPLRSIGGGDKTRFTIRLAFQNKGKVKHGLGRFRLSWAGEAEMVHQADWFLAASTPQAKVGASYLVVGDAKRSAEFLTKATAANPKLPAADWLVLVLAHAKLKETDLARTACGKAAELLKPTGADAALRPLLREVLRVMGANSPAATALIAAAAGELPAALNEAVQQNPDKAKGYRERGDWFAERGLWKEAIADFTEVFRLEPNTYIGMRLGILLIHTGDIDRYRAHCQAMLERWASTEKNGDADMTLKTIVFLPDSKADAKQLARLAEIAVSGDKNMTLFEWYLFAKGLHDYRTGKYADALATCRESRRRAQESKFDPHTLETLNLTIEAMALHRSGDEAGAKRALAEAKSNIEVYLPPIGGGWTHDGLSAHILYRESEGLITGKKFEPPK